MTRRHYSNPPIEEAVCEFRFAPGQAWNFTVPGLFYEKARDLYTGEPSEQNSIAVVSLITSEIRTINISQNDQKGNPLFDYKIDVCPRPTDDNPSHAQIEPSPNYTNKTTFKKVAEKLARLALRESRNRIGRLSHRNYELRR